MGNEYSETGLVRATDFFRELSGKTWAVKQMNDLAKERTVRQKLHLFAEKRGWCKKLENGKYRFDRMDFHPIIVKLVLKDCKEYNASLQSKEKFDKKVAKQEKQIKQKPTKAKTPMFTFDHKGKVYQFEISQETIVKIFSKMMESLDKTTTLQSKYNTLEEIYHRNIQELKDNGKHFNTETLQYEKLLQTYKERIEELEKEREVVRDLCYEKVITELNNETNN